MTIKELLVGKKVRQTDDCNGTKKGRAYKIEKSDGGRLYIGEEWSNGCICLESWELIDPLNYKPEPHKHTYICECGEKK